MIVRAKTKVRLLILLIGVAVLIGGGATVFVVRKGRIEKLYVARRAAGMAQYQKGDYVNALLSLGSYIRRPEYSRDAEAIYAFAESRRRVETPDGRHLRDAMTTLQRVLALQPERMDVKRELLELYTQLGYNIEAVDLADKLLEIDKNDPQALRAKARGLAASQKSEEARIVCDYFNSIVPLDLEIRVLSMEVLRDLRKRPEILTQAHDLLVKYPNDGKVELIASIGFTFVEEIPVAEAKQLEALIRKQYPDALPKPDAKLKPGEKLPEAWDPYQFSQFFAIRAAQHDLGDLLFVRYLVEQLDRIRLVGESLAVLQKVDSQQDTAWVRLSLIRRLWESGRFSEVLKRMEKLDLSGATVGDVELLAIRGVSQARTDLKEPARETITTLANLKEDRIAQAWATIIQELVLKADGDAHKVIESIRYAFELQRNNAYLRYFLGLAYFQLQERDAAMEAFSQAAASRPLWQLPLLHLSRLKLETGQKQAAVEDAFEAFNINRGNLAAAANLAIIWAANTDLSTLKTDSELYMLVAQIQQQLPGEESTLPLYVHLLAKTNQADDAKKIVNNALSAKTAPSAAILLRLAGVSRACNLGLDEACLAAAEKSAGLTPELALARATVMAESGKAADGAAYFQNAMQKAGAADLTWRLAWANFLEQTKDERASAAWIALGDDPAVKSNLMVQREVLTAASAQKDAAFISRTIERIRAVAGDESIGWKMAEARQLLRDGSSAKVSNAVKTLKEVVAAVPSNIDARVLLAMAYDRSGNVPAAIEQIAAARKLQPSSRGLSLELARLYTAQLDFQRAREILDSIPPLSLEPAQARAAARLIGQQGNIPRAINFMERAQADAPPLDRLYLAELYRRNDQQAKAEAIYKSLLEKPDRIEVVMAAADYYASRGQNELALQTLANLEKLPLPPAEKQFALAEFSSRHGTGEQALPRYLAVVQADPSKPNGWRSLVTEYIRLGKADEAVDAAKKAIQALPADLGMPFQNVINSAATLKALSPEKSLVPLMSALLEPSPDGEVAVAALPIIAKAIQTHASPQSVLDQLSGIASRAPGLASLQMLLVQNYIIVGNPEEAAAIALRSQSIAPASAEIARNAAVAVSATGRLGQALAPAQQWRALTPENLLPADLFIAELHLRLQDYVSVLNDLQPYAQQAKDHPREKESVFVNGLRAQALFRRGDDVAAADLMGPSLADQPQIRAVWRDLTHLLPNPLAEKWIARLAAATPPEDVNENIELAFAWRALFSGSGRPRFIGTNEPRHKEAAQAILEHLATIAPDHPIVVQSRAIFAQADNKLGAAEQGYRRALELNPNLAYSLNNLAMMLSERGDYKEAISLAERAVKLDPSNAKVRDTLAFVQLKMKDYPKAQENLKVASKLEPQNIKWRIKLAQVYDEAGQPEELSKVLDEIEKITDMAKLDPTERETIRQLRSKVPPKTALR